ncbi:MAG: phosphatase PAP2 family protein [Bacteroidetes bacterium]|nr:phosphatase PAP2 family protein [Bacteroidota bacterium]
MKPSFRKLQAGRTGLFVFASLLFITITILVFVQHSQWPDDPVFAFISPYRNADFTRSMNFVTFYGNHDFLVPANLLLVILFFVRKNKGLAWFTLVTALSSLGLMSLIKNLVQRHRPVAPLVSGVTNYSFPSGHAFMSVAFYGLLIWLALTYYSKDKWKQRLLILFLLLLIFTIGFSRIYLRLHYTTDVVAGLCLGTMWLLILLTLAEIWLFRQKKRS